MLNYLKREITIFIIAISLSIVAVTLSNNHFQDLSMQKDNAIYTLNQAKNTYYDAIEKKNRLSLFEEKYQALKKQGIIGEESRLNWVDSLENIRIKYKIPYIKYTIEQQQPFVSEILSQNYPAITLLKSTMILHMQLLHEGDLYTIINNLRIKAIGLFDVQSCAIIRNETQINSILDSPTDKNFSATCTLNWYTIKSEHFQQTIN